MEKKIQSTNEGLVSSTDKDIEELELFIEKKKIQNQAFQKIIENLSIQNENSKE
jgi:hypothetical protein